MDITIGSVPTFHGVLTSTDDHASHPANIDLACMLVQYLEAKVVVEAGTYRGHFAFAVANVLRQMEQGMVYTADPIAQDVPGLLLEAPTIAEYIHYELGTFEDLMTRVPDPIDLGYIDASSKANPHMRWQHAEMVYQRLKPGGLILVDDTEGDWEDAKRFQRYANIHLSQHRGLSIIQRAK